MDEHTNIVRGIARSLENVPYALSARFPQQLNEAADALSQQAEEIRKLMEQRDRLLEALKDIKHRMDDNHMLSRSMVSDICGAAINQVEANK